MEGQNRYQIFKYIANIEKETFKHILRETDFCAKMLITYHHVVYTITLIFMSRIQI